MTRVRVDDNGYQMLVARLVSQLDDSLVTLLPDDEIHYADEECIELDGTVTHTRRPWTDEERDDVAQFTEDYLTAAGVEPFPRGMAVHLELPSGVESMDRLVELLLGDIGEEPTFPGELAAVLRPAIRARYR